MSVAAERPAVARAGGVLCEHALCRVAGLPVRLLEEMRARRTVAAAEEALRLEAELEAAGPRLADGLFAAIGAAAERTLRGRLIGLRRDLHNGRPVDPARAAALAPALPPDLARDLARHAARSARLAELEGGLAALYAEDATACRRLLQAAVGDPDFQKGLLMASRDLTAGLERYVRADAGALGAKERQIERGLLRYLSRMVMKPSPFGTFTAVVPGRFVPEGAGELAFAGDPRAKRSQVRLNKRIFALLLPELLADPAVRARVGVELNPTLRAEGGQWLFLSAVSGREVFQRVPQSTVLDLFQEVLAASSHLPLGELERQVAGRPEVDASAEEVSAFTERLLAIGFLRLRLGIPEQEVDWDRPLRRLLLPVGSDEATRALRLLDGLRAGRDAFAEAPVERRRELLDEVSALVLSYESLTRRASLRSDVPFYEDSTADAVLDVPESAVEEPAAALAEWVRLTSRLAWPRHEQAAMRRFFEGFYAGGGPVPLLRFYEDYYREHYKEHLARQFAPLRPAEAEPEGEEGAGGEREPVRADDLNPFGLAVVERIRAANDELKRRLRRRWREAPDAPGLALDRRDLEEVTAGIPPQAVPCYSVSFFAQLLPGEAPDGGPAMLVSNYLAGYGKYFSRFLGLLPDRVRADLVRGNEELSDEILAEICGDGGFNANLHPPLVPWEISYPTGESGPAERQILTSDLDVEPAPGDPHALCLRHRPSGRRVVPLDLGFLNPIMRPPLFQLLVSFAPAANYHLEPPEAPWERGEEPPAPGAVLHRPRLTYGDRLVLGRARWTVPAAAFPKRETSEPDARYFLRVERWRREHGIPREVFTSLRWLPPAGGGPAAGEGAPRRRVRDHLAKPQYVDFANPLLVDLFGRSVEALDDFEVRLYERLPDRRHLARAGDDRWVTELVVQLDFPGGDGL